MFQEIKDANVSDILARIRSRLPAGHLVCVMDNHSLEPIAAGAVEDDEVFKPVQNRHVWLAYYNNDGMGIEGEHAGQPAEIICVR